MCQKLNHAELGIRICRIANLQVHTARRTSSTRTVSKHPHKNSKTNMTSSRRSIRRGEQYYLRFNIDCSSNMPDITEFGNTGGKRSDHMQGERKGPGDRVSRRSHRVGRERRRSSASNMKGMRLVTSILACLFLKMLIVL